MNAPYVAMVETSVQVTEDRWETRKLILALEGTESIKDVLDWARRSTQNPQVLLVETIKWEGQ